MAEVRAQMTQAWILEVLGDLEAFARLNGLPTLAAQLQLARHVARAEIAAVAVPSPADVIGADKLPPDTG